MDKFWQLLKESVLVQGLITLALVGAVIYLSCAGLEIPTIVETSTGLVLGYYFGSKAQMIIAAQKVK
jgi:hypothetical protein